MRFCAGALDDSLVCVRAARRPLAGDSEPLSQGRRSPRLCRDDDKAPKSLCRFDLCPRPGAIFEGPCAPAALPAMRPAGGGRISGVFGRSDSWSSPLFGLAPGQRSCPPATPTRSIQQIAKIITWCLLCRGGGEAGGEKLKKTRERKEKVFLCLSRTLGGLEARPLRHTIETSCHAPPRCLRCAHDVVSSDVTNGGAEY